MANRQYIVASAAQLVGVSPVEEIYDQGISAMDHANKEQSRFQRTTVVKNRVDVPPGLVRTDETREDSLPGTNIFTHSRHASWSSSGPTTAIPESLQTEKPPEQSLVLLQPVAYTPPGDKTETGDLKTSTSNDSQLSVKERVKEYESQLPLQDPPTTISSDFKALTVDLEASNLTCSPSSESTGSARRRGRRSDGLEIYFTPTDYTKSTIFLSSPQNSPTLPDGETVDEATTPRASTKTSRPSSEIYVGAMHLESRTKNKEKLRITPDQLDQLVTALARAPMIQKDVRKHWWDVDDIPDDETMSTFSGVSIPTLTSASTLYSQMKDSLYSYGNDDFMRSSNMREQSPAPHSNRKSTNNPSTNKRTPPIDAPFGGVALTDPKIHGSPNRYVSKSYRIGPNIQTIGTCSFVQVPYGIDTECTLRVEPRSNYSTTSRVLFQCVNQVVDRKSGTKTHLLVADEDVTEHFAKAALAEFATFTDTPPTAIDVAASPTISSPFSSPEIDWITLADDLQVTSETNALIDSTFPHFISLTPETALMQTHTLLSTLERIKDQQSDFLLLQPTTFHANGVPGRMRLPWVSQRLWKDWYAQEGNIVGEGAAAKGFTEDIVAAVAKRSASAGGAEDFTTGVNWGDERLVVRCVPLGDGGKGVVWACFVRGMFDI